VPCEVLSYANDKLTLKDFYQQYKEKAKNGAIFKKRKNNRKDRFLLL